MPVTSPRHIAATASTVVTGPRGVHRPASSPYPTGTAVAATHRHLEERPCSTSGA